MFAYLDTCIVIYSVEGQAPFRQRAQTHIAALESAGYRFFVSDLTRGECLVHPLGRGDATLLLRFISPLPSNMAAIVYLLMTQG